MRLTLGFSPCPNDTFIFDALVNKKIDTGGLDFETFLEDVQTLNQRALEGRLDISKVSYGVLPLLLKEYVVLSSGGALGKGVGPLLISNTAFPLSAIKDKTIAIPGENTTAHLLFSLAFPDTKKKVFKVFNEIEDAVLNQEVDAGVIIHENRFTYQLKGLHKLMDLGEYWEQTTNGPIPLGGIVIKRSLGAPLIQKTDDLIRKSVEYAFQYHHKELTAYVLQHAQEMNEEVMQKHIDLYVNQFSVDLGGEGKKSVLTLLDVYQRTMNKNGLDTPLYAKDVFLQ